MKRTICILLAVTMFIVMLSGCAAVQNTENTPAPTEAPTATPAPATATPEPTSEPTPESTPSVTPEPKPEASEVPVESVVSNEGRIYSLEDFFDLPIGRSSAADLIVQNLHEPSNQLYSDVLIPDYEYFTADPDVKIYLGYGTNVGYIAVDYLNCVHETFNIYYDEDTDFEGTFVDVNELGIIEIKEGKEWNTVVSDQTYSLQDFAWIKLGETTFEEVCKWTTAEDYFYFYRDHKILCYPSEVSGAFFYVDTNADGIVCRVKNVWEAKYDPEAEAFFTEEYDENACKIILEYLRKQGHDVSRLEKLLFE
ncbi:MAG: hypothetical protein IJF56_06535 [Clostridia bacterium]|nr:hypothetical protein [Clostridia bacterium]